MTITETSRGYELQFDYRPHIVRELKEMAGFRFQGKERGWMIPHFAKKTMPDGTIIESFHNKRLMEQFKKKYLVVSEGADAPEQFYKVEDMPKLTIDIPWREGVVPYPYQKEDIARGLQFKSFINGNEPGLGKTMEAIGTILGFEVMGYKPFPCLIVCPSTLKENWRREWEEKFSHKRALILDDKNKHTWHQYYRMGMADVFIVNYESLKKYFVTSLTSGKKNEAITLKTIQFNPIKDLIKSIIFDESHRLKEASSIQTKLSRGISIGKEFVIELTGTPVVNKPKDLASQLAILGKLQQFGGFKFFMDRYCQGGTGAGNLNELNGKLLTTCFFRREKKDVLFDLPEKTREVFTCDITTRDEYNKAKNDLGAWLKDCGYSQKQVDKSMNAEIMVRIGVLKSISARGKLPELYEHIDELVAAKQKVVVFIHQKFMAEAILSHYPGSVSVRGDDDRDARQRNVDAFQNDPNCLIIVCSIKAAGVGLTLTAASRELIAELPWHAADVEQMEARIDRIGQKNATQISYFLGKNTIDEDIYKIIEAKRDVANAITGSTTSIDTMITDLTRSLFNQK